MQRDERSSGGARAGGCLGFAPLTLRCALASLGDSNVPGTGEGVTVPVHLGKGRVTKAAVSLTKRVGRGAALGEAHPGGEGKGVGEDLAACVLEGGACGAEGC